MSEEIPSKDTQLLEFARLKILLPDGTEQIYRMLSDVVRIGRKMPDLDIDLPDTLVSISRSHCEVAREGGKYWIRDLKSANGVYLNGERITKPEELHHDDVIRIGELTMGHEVRIIFQGGSISQEQRSVTKAPPADDFDSEDIEAVVEVEGTSINMRLPDGKIRIYPLAKKSNLIGRSDDADVRIPDNFKFVSQKHAGIIQKEDGYVLIDLKSTNGTRLNNRLIVPGQETSIHHGAIIRVGDSELGSSIGLIFQNPGEEAVRLQGYEKDEVSSSSVRIKAQTFIGRAQHNDIILAYPTISRQHARVDMVGDQSEIVDLSSRIGVFLNGARIQQAPLVEGDLIEIGPYKLLFQDGKLFPYSSQGMRVDVVDLTKDVKDRGRPKRRILHEIDMSVLPREFIALVGGSGAGKSTLMNALIGANPGGGRVYLNGYDYYEEIDRFRRQLGYVPQSDILHLSLTVEKALDYAARLRLPSDVSKAERKDRIGRALETVSMNTETIRGTRVSNLSGGQRKRISIAAELLADPKLIFLDEATSGLDPGLEKKMMYTLRQMADEGRTIVLITHATANIVQADLVLFLSQGRMVYYGPTTETLDYFQVDDFADIYGRIEQKGEWWENVFRKKNPEFHERYVAGRQRSLPKITSTEKFKSRFGIRDFIRQFGVMTQRALDVIMSDVVTLVLLLLLFPLTATLQLVISTPEILIGNLSILADPVAAAVNMVEPYIPFADTNIFVFVMGLEAVLVGMYVPSNELIKERSIYLRERMMNLKIPPYLLSKVGVFTIFSALQVMLYLVVLSLGVDLPEEGLYLPGGVELFVTLFLTMMAGVGLGLLVSALSRSSDMAIYVLVILLFFQFFFGGTVFDLRDNPAEPISYLTTTRWSLIALGVTIDMPGLTEATILCNTLPDDPRTPGVVDEMTQCFNFPEATEELMLPYDDESLLFSWLMLIAMTLVTVGLAGVLVKRLDKI